MGYYNFLGVLEIIKGSIKILPKNGKIMALIATLGLLLNSFSFLLYTYFFKPLLSSMNAKPAIFVSKNLTESESDNLLRSIKIDASILIGVSLAYFFIYFLIALSINVSTIYASAMSLCGHDLSLKDLLLRVIRSFKRIRIISSRGTSYTVLWIIVISTVLIVAILLGFPVSPFDIILISIAIMVPTYIYSLYNSVVRVLAFVISVIEENYYGTKALRKAEELVKGRRVDGFVLNLLNNLFVVIIFLVYEIIVTKWPSKEIVMGLFLICILYLVIMFSFISYTFLYFKCKESHGEEIESRGKLGYSKAPTAPLLNEDVP